MRRGQPMVGCFVSASQETLRALEEWAWEHQVTRSDAVREALTEFLEGRLEPVPQEDRGGRLVRTYVSMPPEWFERLDREAARRRWRRAELIRHTVEAWLQRVQQAAGREA